MDNVLVGRLERIKIFINNGFTVDLEEGLVYSPSRGYNSDELKLRGSLSKHSGYVDLMTTFNGKQVRLLAHHLVYYLATGKVVNEIDHKDRVRSNNRFDNLREVSKGENMLNKTIKGYTFRKDINKYRVEIKIDGIRINIGNFNSEQEARDAYLEAKEKYHIIGNREQSVQNAKNRTIKKTKGYYWCNHYNKWKAQIWLNGKSKSLGYFINEEDAEKAYIEAKSNRT